MGKTWALVIGLIILTGALLYLSISENKNPAPTPQITAEPKQEKPQTTLSFSDEDKYATGSSLLKTDVLINSGKNKVTGAQIELLYDPKVLTKVDVVPGNFLKNPTEILKKIDIKTGRISYVLGTKLNTIATGQGVLATITYLRLNNNKTTIEFLPQTIITAEEISQSALIDSKSAVLEVKPKFLQNYYSSASSTIR